MYDEGGSILLASKSEGECDICDDELKKGL